MPSFLNHNNQWNLQNFLTDYYGMLRTSFNSQERMTSTDKNIRNCISVALWMVSFGNLFHINFIACFKKIIDSVTCMYGSWVILNALFFIAIIFHRNIEHLVYRNFVWLFNSCSVLYHYFVAWISTTTGMKKKSENQIYNKPDHLIFSCSCS